MGRLEGKDLIPAVRQYDPKRNFRKLRFALGYVPWEEGVAALDKAVAWPPISSPSVMADEPPIGPGLQPPPAAHPAVPATPPKN